MSNTPTKEDHLEVGRAILQLMKTWPVTTILMSIIFPLAAGRIARLTHALHPLVEDSVFGTDEELGL